MQSYGFSKVGRRLATAIGAATLLTAVATPAHANQLAYEGFNYTTGANLAGNNGGTGWTAPWTTTAADSTIAASSLSYTDSGGRILPTTGGSLSQISGKNDFRAFTTTVTPTTGSLYISYIAQKGSGTPGAFFGLSLFSGGTATETMFTGAPSADFWGISPKVGTNVNSTSPATTQAFLVYRIDFNGSTEPVSLYVNPPLNAEPGTPSATTSRTTTLSYDTIRIASSINSTIDEIRIGTTYADVVPEPGSLSLAAPGVVGLLARRRARNTGFQPARAS